MRRPIFLIFLLISTFAYAQTSINVPIGDKAYRLVEKLAASGVIKTPFYGQRPWTREYVVKLIVEANREKDKLTTAIEEDKGGISHISINIAHKRYIDSIIKELSQEFAEELNVEHRTLNIHPLPSLSFAYTYLNNSPTPLAQNAGGRIDGTFYPLAANREGRKYEKGQNFYWETEHSAQITEYFAAYLHPEFNFVYPSSGDDNGYARIHDLYAKTGWNNIELEVGRDQLLWGEGLHGGLMFSDNPRGLDMIKLSTPYPLFGILKATALGANLGPEYSPSWPWLAGYRLDFMPANWWNLGVDQIIECGGSTTSREVGADMRFVVEELRGTNIYGEIISGRWEADNLSWLGGVYIPRLDHTGKWGLRVEYENIGKDAYQDSTYTSGWTLNKMLLGNTSGPDSQKVTTTLDYSFTPSTTLKVDGGYIQRANDGTERHILNNYTLELPLNHSSLSSLIFRSTIGWDHIVNKKTDLIAEVGLKIYFPEF